MADEFDKSRAELQKQVNALSETTKGFNKPFKNAIDELKNINIDVAETAANLRKNSKDSFAGMLASNQLLKAQRKAAADPEFAKVNSAVKESLRKQEEIQNSINDKLQSSATLIEMQKTINEKVLEAENLGVDSTREQKEKALKEISDLESELAKAKETEVALENRRLEETKKATDVLVAVQKKNNDKVKKDLEDASSSESFGKFSSGLKELSGGIIDISAVLDPLVSKFNAVKDVGGGLLSAAGNISEVVQGFDTGGQGDDGNSNIVKEKAQGLKDRILGNKKEKKQGEKVLKDKTTLSKKNNKVDATNLKNKKVIGGKLGAISTAFSGILATLGLIFGGLALILLGVLAVPIAIGAAIAAITTAFSAEAFAGVGIAIKESAERITGIFKGAGKALSEGISKLKLGLGIKPKPTPKPTPKPKVPLKADGTPDKRFKVNKLAGEGVEETVKQSGRLLGGIKNTAKFLTKKLPFLGAAAETGFDLKDQQDKIEQLRKAREDGTLMKKDDVTGESRAYTDEEFKELEDATLANKAGSVGKGAGSLAGGLGGALLGAKVGASLGVIGGPVGIAVGGFLGSLVGGIGGAIVGGLAGDEAATSLAGDNDSQRIVDQAVANLPTVDGDAIADSTLATTEAGENASVASNTVVTTQSNSNDNSQTNTFVSGGQNSARNRDNDFNRTAGSNLKLFPV